MIAITLHDLYPGPDWSYVFGWATYTSGVGVFGFSRFDPGSGEKREETILHISCKIIAHETCHMFNLRHCIHNHCIMGGINSCEELDTHPLKLCI